MKTLTAVLVVAMASTAYAERDRVELMSEGASRSNAGDHAAAIALYEQAYLYNPDPSLLPIIASEYRAAGLPLDAISYFCDYLTKQPKGLQAAFSTTQVVAIHAELGQVVAKDRVCGAAIKPTPIRVDFVTPRRAPHPEKPGMSKREMAGVATAAFGLASLGASLYYGARASAISDQLSNHPPYEPWPDNIAQIEERGQRFEDRRNMFAIAGGVALVTAGVLYFTGRADRLDSEKLIIAPTVTPGGGGISFARGF